MRQSGELNHLQNNPGNDLRAITGHSNVKFIFVEYYRTTQFTFSLFKIAHHLAHMRLLVIDGQSIGW